MKGITAIILAAGKGERLQSRVPKPLIRLNNKPLVSYSLKAFNSHPEINDIVVVAHKDTLDQVKFIIKQEGISKVCCIVEGGKRRQDSVANGLEAVFCDSAYVLIHDCARPFVDAKIISAAISGVRKCGACIVGVPVKATIKETSGNNIVARSLKRENLREIQTPQAFKKELLDKAFKKFYRAEVTDDAMLVEKLGVKVRIAPGSYDNIKITTPEDIVIAEAIMKNKIKNFRSNSKAKA